MEENTVVAFRNPSNFQDDPLTEVLRAGARELLAQAVEAEVAEFLEGHATLVDDRGRRRIVRNGHLPERLIQTGIGPVDVRQPRVRDRRAGEGAGAIRFTSAILPRYLRRTKSLEDLLPWLYLRGISSGDFSEALAALLGAQAPGLSASTIGRLKEVWQDEMERWQRRDLSAKRNQGVDRHHRRLPRERTILARGAARSQAVWSRHRPGTGDRRWPASGRRSAKSTGPPASSAAGCIRRAIS